jgi:hypothetical protein
MYFGIFDRPPPVLDAPRAAAELKRLIETNTPYQAKVVLDTHSYGMGWAMPPLLPITEFRSETETLANRVPNRQ